MKVYVSGPMTGYPNHNFPAFNEAAECLRKLGYEVVNPAEINIGTQADTPEQLWNACLRKDIIELMACDSIVLLPGWEVSAGAQAELHLSHRVGIRPYIFNDFLNLHYLGKVQP